MLRRIVNEIVVMRCVCRHERFLIMRTIGMALRRCRMCPIHLVYTSRSTPRSVFRTVVTATHRRITLHNNHHPCTQDRIMDTGRFILLIRFRLTHHTNIRGHQRRTQMHARTSTRPCLFGLRNIRRQAVGLRDAPTSMATHRTPGRNRSRRDPVLSVLRDEMDQAPRY